MKLLAALFALVSLSIFAPNLYADPVLDVNVGVAGVALVETPIANGDVWVYNDDTVTMGTYPGLIPIPWSQTDSNLFTATFTDIGGVALLNITDVCANTAVLAPINPCALDFSFSDTDLGVPYLISDLGLDIGVGGTVAIGVNDGVDILGVDIGGGSAQIGFGAPPPPPPSATPEPGSLTLLGTSLLGAAGIVRKRFFAV